MTEAEEKEAYDTARKAWMNACRRNPNLEKQFSKVAVALEAFALPFKREIGRLEGLLEEKEAWLKLVGREREHEMTGERT